MLKQPHVWIVGSLAPGTNDVIPTTTSDLKSGRGPTI